MRLREAQGGHLVTGDDIRLVPARRGERIALCPSCLCLPRPAGFHPVGWAGGAAAPSAVPCDANAPGAAGCGGAGGRRAGGHTLAVRIAATDAAGGEPRPVAAGGRNGAAADRDGGRPIRQAGAGAGMAAAGRAGEAVLCRLSHPPTDDGPGPGAGVRRAAHAQSTQFPPGVRGVRELERPGRLDSAPAHRAPCPGGEAAPGAARGQRDERPQRLALALHGDRVHRPEA